MQRELVYGDSRRNLEREGFPLTSDFEYVQPPDGPKRRATDNLLPKADLSDPSLHTAKELRKTLRILIAMTCILYIVVGGIAVLTYRQSVVNTRALCTIRQNAQTRADQTTDFLKDHPNGIAGITVEDLRRSIDASNATVKALDDVSCSEPPTP